VDVFADGMVADCIVVDVYVVFHAGVVAEIVVVDL